jgi:hypothetical protein
MFKIHQRAQFQETRRMSRIATTQESKKKNIIKMCFLAEMPPGTCELSCALITNLYTICKYEKMVKLQA